MTAISLNGLARRRLRNLGLALAVATVAVVAARRLDLSVYGSRAATGWTLLALVAGLSLYGARKRLPGLPLGNASGWLQLHAWAGLVAGVVFALHVGLAFPRSPLEIALGILFLAVAGSGVAGILLARSVPREVAIRGEVVLPSRIPEIRKKLRERAERLVVGAAGPVGAFHLERLEPFLARRRNLLAHALRSRRPLEDLLAASEEVGRWLGPARKETLREIQEIIRDKDHLDFLESSFVLLRGWLFVHGPLTAALAVAAVAHVLVARAYLGGAG